MTVNASTQNRTTAMTSRKVGFIIAGTQKGGTTALDAYLREHPGIAMASRKEVHFFNDDERFPATGCPHYDWYQQFFVHAPAPKLLGEATPSYMYWPPAPERIRAYNPDIKLIMVLRNPITRAFSHWNMEHSRRADRLSFWDAIRTEDKRCSKASAEQRHIYSYVARGFYTRQLARVWASIPRHQTLVIRNEQLKREPQATIDTVCDFLGVERMHISNEKDVFSLSYKTSMSRREWIYLANRFELEILRLERLLGWNCKDWLNMPQRSGA